MEMNQTSNRLHPLMIGAAVSVMLVSLLGAAAITGILPNSHSTTAEPARIAAAQPAEYIPAQAQVPTPAAPVVVHKTIVHHQYVTHRETPVRQSTVSPTYQQTAAVTQNSPVGIGVGAVVGGVLGNQIGKGNGRTLATIAGALGGGYVGNEIAKRNQ